MARTRLSLLLRVSAVLAGAGALFVGGAAYEAWPRTGALATGTRFERMAKSPHWKVDHFVDTIPRVEPDLWESTRRWVQGVSNSTPDVPLPVLPRTKADFAAPPATGLRVTWLGHSTLLVELDGHRVLIDPVWGERCSPFTFAGPKRFHPPPLPLAELPEIEAVIISHDHYDHLDHPTITALADRPIKFFVPLGIGAHLEAWGVAPDKIVERDWWEEDTLGDLRIVAVPARHFSGRSLVMTDRDRTLWAGWALLGPKHRIYYSGDTAMFPGFKEIGERLGPFDLTMIEVGAYDQLWADVHLGPEQAIAAHLAVGGDVMLPVHWGTFDLALHTWVEPIERVIAAAAKAGVKVVSPRPGESIDSHAPASPARWWPETPWSSAEKTPVVSSGL